MTHRKLPSQKTVYRIGDSEGRYPIFSGEGAKVAEGRWHQKGQDPIYAAEHLSLAMLEKLVHFNGIIPARQHSIEIVIPKGTTYEVVSRDSIPNWYDAAGANARKFGSEWFLDMRSCVLIVPSVVVRTENNLLINPNHADFPAIKPGLEIPVTWDERLYAPPA